MRRVSAVATVGFLGAALFVGTAAARAADPKPPAVPLTVVKTGYYTSNINGALPPVLVKEVPPAPVCLVVPQVCGSEVNALKTALSLNDGVPLPKIPDYLVPQPVPPGELPIGMMGGATRYSSVMQFTPPKMESHATVNSFDLNIKDGTVKFSIESPAFRESILAVLSQYPEQQPEVIDTFVNDVTSQNTALSDFDPTGIELCMVLSPWDAGASQDPSTKPKTDCIVGAIGERDENIPGWTFDLSGIVQAWADGAPNYGISLSPLGAQNVAYGDPDPSTNFVLTLLAGADASAPTARFDIGAAPPPDEIPIDSGLGVDTSEPALDTGGALPDLGTGAGASVDALSTGSQAGSASVKTKLASHAAGTPWWVWLVVPFVLAGCAALAQALDAVPDLATRRPGALTRLTADMDRNEP